MSKKPYILGIDGMQHTGKGELIKMLVPYFQELGYNVLVMKGAGSRSGRGSSDALYDPVDDFRKELTPQLYNNPLIESIDLREQGTVKLQKELYSFLNQERNLPDIILLDRTIITSNFLRRLTKTEETIQETARYYQEQYTTTLYLPNSLLVFYTQDQGVLEARVNKQSSNAALKLETISHNSSFNQSIVDVKNTPDLYERTLLINTDPGLEVIHNLVRQALNKTSSPLHFPGIKS